jgi:DNA helicase-2/ATP-dependent DNA helicase PcrA
VKPRTRKTSILDDLNDRQRAAVEHGDGPLLIFAGAGSGKTRVLTYRMAYLIQERGAPPDRVLAVTFTNKAASEMRQRIARLIGGVRWGTWIGTFHHVCARLLRQHVERVDRTANFVIFDEADQATLMKEALEALKINPKIMPPQRVLATISHAKNELLAPEDYRARARDPYQRDVARAYLLYQQRLGENNALDFDDLIMFTVRLLEDHPELLADYQEKFLHLLVDEFQDINFAQYRFVQLLAAKHRNLAVVGDDDQSIYGWRGADFRIILEFEHDYPEATVVKLEQNYRSTAHILDAAYHVISRNQARRDKRLWTEQQGGALIVVHQAGDEHQEASFVANTIQELMQSERRRYADFAVLYRINAQSRVLETVFISAGLPYRIIGGVRFYERKEIKDILAYLRIIVNPFDRVSLRRIVNTPPRGIGDVTLQQLEAVAQQRGMDLLQVALSAEHLDLPARARDAVAEFARVIAGLMETAASASLTDLVSGIIERTGYRRWLAEQGTIQAKTRLENIRELLTATREYEAQGDNPTAAGFLEQISLLADQDELKEGVDAVPLMTLHAAKGLEFPAVFIVGMEDGLLPLARATENDNEDDLEEERRLCYVGMTRAKERLYLTLASHRTMYGMGRPTAPSRFLQDIPRELVQGAVAARPPAVTWASANSEGARAARRIVTERGGGDAPFKPGDRVRHRELGIGVVVSYEARGGHGRVTVAFDKQGIRKLDLDYTGLEKVRRGRGR